MCVSASPGYAPPMANFDCDSTEVMTPSFSTAPAKKGKKGESI